MENKVEICQSLDFEFMSFLGLPNILKITKAKQREEIKKKKVLVGDNQTATTV